LWPPSPLRVLAIEILKLGNRAVEVFLIAKRVTQIVTDAGLVGVQALGRAIFRDGLVQLALIVQDDAKIAVRFPEVGAQAESVAIGDGGAAEVSLLTLGNSNIEVDVGVRGRAGGFARERLVESVQRSIVVATGVERESERTVGLGVGRIHAERRARFGKSVLGIVVPIEKVRNLTVGFGGPRHLTRRFGEFIKRIVEAFLAAQERSKDVMQPGVFRRISAGLVAQQSADFVFRGVEIVLVNQSGNLCRRAGADAGA
jgi:hypothetical protein